MFFSKELLETIFSHQTSFMYILDTDLRVAFASKALLDYLRVSDKEVSGKTLQEIGYSEETSVKLNQLFTQVLNGKVVSGEDVFVSISGVSNIFEYSFAPIKDKDQKVIGVSAMSRNISDRKKIEADLNTSIEELQKERELRESFITAMTHDLRTPLTAAKLSAQIIQKHPGDLKAITKFSTRIIENVERTDMMIRDLLDSLRLKAGEGIMLNVQQNIMNALLESMVEDLATIHGTRFQLIMNEMVKGYWDNLAIRRVLENLISNALKYGRPEGPITVTLFKENSFICVSVHNEGDAIRPEEMPYLFVPFKRLKSARESGQKGWGIGLTLVMGIVEAHQGTVAVESLAGKGTTFTIKIPA